jgi:plastocyanin
MTTLFMHELGHNAGSEHVNGSGVMNPYIQNTSTFSTSARNQITSYLSGASCVTEEAGNSTYTVSGRVLFNSSGLSGVSVTLSGAGSTTTNGSGNFSFPNISDGTYTLSGTKSGYTIGNQSVTVSGANASKNLTASQNSSPPNITTHPSSLSTFAGIDARFNCSGTGSSYQWQSSTGGSWSNVSGASGSTYVVSSVTTAMSGHQYRCVNSNTAGSATSNAATLTVSAVPSLSVDKTSVSSGDQVRLTLSSSIASPHTVTWLRGSSSISSSRTTSITTNVSTTSTYSVRISLPGSDHQAITNSVTVTVAGSLGITLAPGSGSLTVGTPQILTATVSGGFAPYTYTFYKVQSGNDQQLQQGGSNTISVTPVAADLGKNLSYYVVVSDRDSRTAQSSRSNFGVGGAPIISEHPQSVTAAAGDTVTFSITASANGIIHYLWYVDGVSIPGTGNPTFRLRDLSVADSGKRVTCKVSDRDGNFVMSNPATVTVNGSDQPPIILSLKGGGTFSLGKKVTLKVQAKDHKGSRKGLTYAWSFNGTALAGKKNTYKVGNLTAEKAGRYQVVVTSRSGGQVAGSFDVGVEDASSLSMNVRIRGSKKAGKVGSKKAFTCLAKAKPKKVWKSVKSTAQFIFKLAGQTVATQTGKKAKKYRHPIAADDDGKEMTCSVVVGSQTFDSSNSMVVRVR